MSQIEEVIITPLTNHSDSRGWLSEVWRADDEIFITAASHPQMAYVSLTHPGVVRGPHEHREQSDLFVFFDGIFFVYLWDKTGEKTQLIVGERNPVSILVPPGVVHAYENVGLTDALVLNFPNRLYGGWKRGEVVDEVRHEEDIESLFKLISREGGG
jgi:dTDP-4-dehydrorhamnose 3,5-epimerase